MAVQFIVIQNRQGKTRLAKWYKPRQDENSRKVNGEVHRLVASRDHRFQSNFVDYKENKIVYRRYAGLFFSVCIEHQDNELFYLEAIHLFVETLDTFFGSVCELDIVFNFVKVYSALDEVFLAGELSETSKKTILGRLEEFERQQ